VARSDPLAEALANVDLFSGLSPKELRFVVATAREAKFDEGTTITSQGEKGGRFYLILEGEVDVLIDGCSQNRMVAGEYFGEMSLLDGEPRAATVVAATPLRLLGLASFNFKPLLREHHSIAEKLLVTLSRRVRAAERNVTC
jgi:CRP/FNR family cyclic AMP-dependent transcriptional regulator